jgi:maleate isomerase
MLMPKIEHRVGLLIPSSNSLIEPEYYAVMPRSVSVHFARLTMTEVTDAGLARQNEDVASQSAQLAAANVEVILFCLTAASFHKGLDYDADLKQRIERESGKPALTAARTVVDALNILGTRRVALAAPFVPEVLTNSRRFLENNGFEVVAAEGLAFTDNYSIALIDLDTVRELVRRVNTPKAEAIIIPGGNMPCLSIVEEMEEELGKPVVTTNQAGIWALLRFLGGFDHLTGLGHLLRERLVD